jgi:ATP-binding cassette subfamily B protein
MTASAERLMELEKIQGELQPDETDCRGLYDQMDALCAQKLCFSYDRDEILKEATFSLPKGAFAVVTGPSGIGKSTILKLLLGVFRPDSGEMYLNCREEKVNLDRSKRRLFAYVPQGNLLLSGTLRENLTITRPGASEEEIRQAVYVSGMEDYLSLLPHGLDTVIGENSTGLSEGQAQRLAIARAVLSGAPILLLDEITSALDAETERLVLNRIRMLPDRTCVAVTHRPAILELADWKLEVSEQGIKGIPIKNK